MDYAIQMKHIAKGMRKTRNEMCREEEVREKRAKCKEWIINRQK